jgi:cell division protein FtsW (lipid II flippase)
MDLLPLIYGVRSTISTFIIIALILRIKYREITPKKNILLYSVPCFDDVVN